MKEQFVKTKRCPFFARGHCLNGDQCSYAHSDDELRPLPDLQKTKLCESVTKGYVCKNGKCTYAHSREELRATSDLVAYKTSLCFFHKKGKCLNGDKCRFAHGLDELKSKEEIEREILMAAQQQGPHSCPPHLLASPSCRSSVLVMGGGCTPPHPALAMPLSHLPSLPESWGDESSLPSYITPSPPYYPSGHGGGGQGGKEKRMSLPCGSPLKVNSLHGVNGGVFAKLFEGNPPNDSHTMSENNAAASTLPRPQTNHPPSAYLHIMEDFHSSMPPIPASGKPTDEESPESVTTRASSTRGGAIPPPPPASGPSGHSSHYSRGESYMTSMTRTNKRDDESKTSASSKDDPQDSSTKTTTGESRAKPDVGMTPRQVIGTPEPVFSGGANVANQPALTPSTGPVSSPPWMVSQQQNSIGSAGEGVHLQNFNYYYSIGNSVAPPSSPPFYSTQTPPSPDLHAGCFVYPHAGSTPLPTSYSFPAFPNTSNTPHMAAGAAAAGLMSPFRSPAGFVSVAPYPHPFVAATAAMNDATTTNSPTETTEGGHSPAARASLSPAGDETSGHAAPGVYYTAGVYMTPLDPSSTAPGGTNTTVTNSVKWTAAAYHLQQNTSASCFQPLPPSAFPSSTPPCLHPSIAPVTKDLMIQSSDSRVSTTFASNSSTDGVLSTAQGPTSQAALSRDPSTPHFFPSIFAVPAETLINAQPSHYED